MDIRRGLLVLLAPLAVVGAQVVERGAVAPMGCWPQRGGSAAHTAESLTAVTRTKPAVAWTHRAAGSLEGEPRVWRSRVFVAASAKRVGRRTLDVLDLRTGKPLVRAKLFKTDLPLAPSVSAAYVAVRSAEDRVEVFSIGRTVLRSEFARSFKGELVGAPLLHGRHLYVRVGDSVRCFDVSSEKELWNAKGEYRGPPALRGEHLYVVRGPSSGVRQLEQLDRSTGKVVSTSPAGRFLPGSLPNRLDDLAIVALRDGVVVIHEKPIPNLSMGGIRWFVVPLRGRGEGQRLAPGRAMPFEGVPATSGSSWIGWSSEANAAFLAERLIPREYPLLGSTKVHAAYRDVRAPVVSGGVLLMGLRAVDAVTFRILWEIEGTGERRVVPARETLLVFDDQELRAFRTANAAVATAASFEELPKATPGRLLLDDGRVLAGSLSIDGEEVVLAGKGRRAKEQRFSKESVALAATDSKVLWFRDADQLPRSLRMLAKDDEARATLDLADRACDGKDPEQVARLLAAARDLAADDKAMALVARRLRSIRRLRRPMKKAIVEEVARREKELPATLATRCWQRIESLGDGLSLPKRLDLLRDHHRRFPKDERVAEVVRTLVPKGVRVPPVFAVADWMDFVEAVRKTAITRVVPPKPGQPDLTPQQLALGSAQFTWRKDLEGIESDNLLVLTPLTSPGSLARALSVGELVCATLDAMCADGKATRDDRHKLKILLYESKKEYLAESSERMHPARAQALAFTAGHYSPGENLSRMFIRRDAPGVEGIMDTYVHELTHHWLATRCPLFRSAEMRRNVGTPGYWIVEGFATMVEEFRFDTRTGSHRSLDPRARSLDIVANAPQLIPWEVVVGINQAQFMGIPRQPGPRVAMRWNLGAARQLSPANLFYSQSAAVCHYLYEDDGGKWRGKLLEYVRLHYTGKARPKTFETLFGEPAAVGARVERWAKKISGGG